METGATAAMRRSTRPPWIGGGGRVHPDKEAEATSTADEEAEAASTWRLPHGLWTLCQTTACSAEGASGATYLPRLGWKARDLTCFCLF